MLEHLPVTSPSFAVVSHTLSEEAIANIHEYLPRGVEQVTGKPYRGTIQEGDGIKAANWITIEGVNGVERATSGSCAGSKIQKDRTAGAYLGAIEGCIMLGMHVEQGSKSETILHELGHAMGFYHTSNRRELMYGAQGPKRSRTFTAQEQYHTQLAYQYPRGTTYAEIKLSTFGPRQHFRPRQLNRRPILIMD